jgi:predicted porin
MINKKFIKIGLTLTTQFLTCSAFADTNFTFNPCTFTIGGQAQFNVSHTYGGMVKGANENELESYGFLDLRTSLGCKINSMFTIEGMSRQRPIVGSGFAAQANRFGSREAWVGVSTSGFGSLRWGRFLNKMYTTLDYPYGDGLNAESSDYGATPTPVTRNMSWRYTSPTIKATQLEFTFGGGAKNQDSELYGKYDKGSFGIDGVYSRHVMNESYENVNKKPLSIGDRNLINSGAFLGGYYQFSNSARINLGVKSSVFSTPSNASGFYSVNGNKKTVTRINSFITTGTYPLSEKVKINPGVVRYFDSKTRGITADDGATMYKVGLIFDPVPDASIKLEFKLTRLDRAGAIPGSGSGLNQAIPDSTDNSKGISDRRWVFNQDYDSNLYKSRNVRVIGITIQKTF